MKKIFIIFGALISCLSVNAKNITTLVMELNDGTLNSFIFSEMPIITMPENDVAVKSESITVEVVRNDVKKFFFSELETAIRSPKINNDIVFNCQDKNNIRVSGLKDGQIVYVYNIYGVMIDSSNASSTGEVTVSLNSDKSGTYILKCGDRSIKIKN